MITVHRFVAPWADTFSIAMPGGAEILTVRERGSQPCIWAKVDTDIPAVVRDFRLAGTGHELDHHAEIGVVPKLNYIGTFTTQDGRLVFHLFEVIEP